MTIREWISFSRQKLKSAGISNYLQETDWIWEKFSGFKKSEQILNPQKSLDEKVLTELNSTIEKRSKRYPLQYILNRADFYRLSFFVDESVLIPRPETEELVKWGIKNLKKSAKILDIGTGSGCIPIALKYHRPDLNVFALDISETALKTAQKNEDRILKQKSIQWQSSNLFSGLKEKNFDAVFSNPPYLSEGEMHKIEPELTFEPRSALCAKEEGLFCYREIARQAGDFLKPGGFVALEIGIGQQKEVEKAFSSYTSCEAIKDFNGITRVLVFQFGKTGPED